MVEYDKRNIPADRVINEKITLPVWKKNLIVFLSWTLLWLPLFIIIKILSLCSILHDKLVDVVNIVDDMIFRYKTK
jgi:hypothetical protein